MELQFHKTPLPGIQPVKQETQTLEETRELRISEGSPDIGSVLGVWGQALLRGKQWSNCGAHITGGVQAWVLYIPQEGGAPQTVEAWIPFQTKWEVPESEVDGSICIHCLLRSADARSISPRKLLVRVNVGVNAGIYLPIKFQQYTPSELPADICLLKKDYALSLPREAGEKAFTMEEELSLPGTAPKLEKLLYYSLRPELIEEKIMADKIVFRGMALLHILYQNEDGVLSTWDFELPFSQYSQLQEDYSQAAFGWIVMALTTMELTVDAEGRLQLKAGMTGQYVICDNTCLEVVEDAYSPDRQVQLQTEELQLFTVTEGEARTIPAEVAVDIEATAVDVNFAPGYAAATMAEDRTQVELGGTFQLLYQDAEKQLEMSVSHWQEQFPVSAECPGGVLAMAVPSGRTMAVSNGAGLLLRGDTLLSTANLCSVCLKAVTALETEEMGKKDPGRPSLILRRAGDSSLWELAKAAGSTVEAITEANQLKGPPEPEQLLLIPVP